MNKGLTNVLIFAVGAAIGSVVTWKLTKDYYEQIANDEIQSVMDQYSERLDEQKERIQNVIDDLEEEIEEEYENIIKDNNYAEEVETMAKGGIHVIHPDEFAEYETYGVETLYYYADKVVANTLDEVLEPDEYESTIGDALEHFGEYEDDSVFVRNDELECYYEILLNLDNYADICEGE